MAESYEINLEIQGGEQPALVMETEGGATDGASARNAEAWANGTRNGEPVTEGDPAYHNNSKYYRDSAAAIVAGDIIDDDAGIGDFNLTWSADKLAKGDESKAPVINVSDQESAAVKTPTDGADGMPMALTVGIEPVQAGSGDPSPSNVRAISGWDAVKISRTGENLFDLNTVTDGYAIGETGSISSNSSFSYSALIPVKTGGKYFMSFISATASSTHTRIHGYNASGTWVQQIMDKVTTSDSLITDSFTIPSGVSQIRISYRTANTEVTISALDEYEISIPSTPGTVYGGTLTVNKDGTGELVVNKSKWTVPRSISDSYLTYSSARGVGVRYTGTTHMKKGSDNSRALCNFTDICMPYNTAYLSTQNWTFFKGAWTSTSEFMEVIEEMYQNETTPEFVWLLDTPVEYTMTASQVNALITSLKGVNYLYADSGNVLAVDYSADTKLYVDEHNAEEDSAITAIKGMIADSDAPVATESHAIGDVFICNNQLLRATSVIASGETISTGTGGNAEVISLAEYIAEQVTKIAGLQTDVNALKALPLPPNDFLLKKLGFADFTYTNASYGTIKMTSNVLTASGGSGSTYCHINLLGTHRVKTGAWGSYTPQSEDFVDIDAWWKVDNSYHARKFCLRNVGSASSGEGTLRVILAKNNGDDTFTYKYVAIGNSRANLGLLDGSPVDLHDWDKISIVFSSMSRPYTLKTYFYIEDGVGGNYTLNNF